MTGSAVAAKIAVIPEMPKNADTDPSAIATTSAAADTTLLDVLGAKTAARSAPRPLSRPGRLRSTDAAAALPRSAIALVAAEPFLPMQADYLIRRTRWTELKKADDALLVEIVARLLGRPKTNKKREQVVASARGFGGTRLRGVPGRFGLSRRAPEPPHPRQGTIAP